jgi:hypothetical protein
MGARRQWYTQYVAISPKMLAILRKVQAAEEQHLADLRASAKREAKEKERIKAVTNSRKPSKRPD